MFGIAAERWGSSGSRVSQAISLQEELPRLPGKPAVQRSQPDRTGESQGPQSFSNGEFNQPPGLTPLLGVSIQTGFKSRSVATITQQVLRVNLLIFF